MAHFNKYLWLHIFIFSFGFAVSGQAQEFRLRAHHIFWKNQEAGTDREIDFGRGVAAKILGKYPLLRDERKVNTFPKLVPELPHSWDVRN